MPESIGKAGGRRSRSSCPSEPALPRVALLRRRVRPAAASRTSSGSVQVEATFRKDGTYVVDLLVDREHLPLQAKGMAVPPDVFLRSIEKSAVIAFDGKPAAHENVAISVVEGKPNVTRLRLTGRTPPSVSRFTFADDAIMGYFVLKLQSEGRSDASRNGSTAARPARRSRSTAPSFR